MDPITKPFLIFLGPQGSGKGTQGDLLIEKYGFGKIVAGDILRAKAEEDSELGRAVKKLLNAGKMVTLDMWESIVGDYLKKLDFTHGVVADGLLRSLDQVQRFEDVVRDLNLPEPIIINITIPEEESIRRLLKRGRADDTPESIRSRLEWTRDQTQPVIEYYRKQNRVIDINGDRAIENVHKDILRALKERKLVD